MNKKCTILKHHSSVVCLNTHVTMYIVDYNSRIVTFPLYEWKFCTDRVSSIDSTVNTKLWGKLPYVSNVIRDLMFREEAYMWKKMFLKEEQDVMKPLSFFDNIKTKSSELKLVCESNHENSIKEMIEEILKQRPNYLDFLQMYHMMASVENIRYEMFQKSFFYELFCHLLSKQIQVCQAVLLAVCEKYFGWEINETFLDETFDYYSHKYAYQIVPRRHGKTFMTVSAYVALLFTAVVCGLRIGYYSHTKDLAQTVKNQVISKCNEWKSKLTHSRFDISYPTDSIVVKIVSDQNTTIFSNDDFNCLAKFKSARNDNALRGDDLHALVVDEAISINKARNGTILAHGQKADNKIIYLTSPVNHKVDEMLEICKSLKYRNDINLYHIQYFCGNDEHLKYAAKQPACPRLMFYKPDHINIDETNRFLTNLLAQSDTSYEDELGITTSVSVMNNANCVKLCPFSERLLTYLKYNVNTIKDTRTVENVFIYLDPNYCDSLTSGIGIVASGLTKDGTPCIMYLDHKFVETEELGKVNEVMVKMILNCIKHVAKVNISNKRTVEDEFKFTKRNFFVAIENNAQRNNCVSMYEKLKDIFRGSGMYNVSLYYTPIENRMTKQLNKRAGFTLLNKFTIFSQTIQYMNEKLIWFSYLLYSYYINLSGQKEIEYLRQNMEHFKFSPVDRKFSGKSPTSTDDIVVAMVMSIYLARTYTPAVETSNWLSLGCWQKITV